MREHVCPFACSRCDTTCPCGCRGVLLQEYADDGSLRYREELCAQHDLLKSKQQPNTLHVVPVADQLGHDSSGDHDCICGPTTDVVLREDGSNGWLVVHHSLDGREAGEVDGA